MPSGCPEPLSAGYRQALRVPRALHCRLPPCTPGTRGPPLKASVMPSGCSEAMPAGYRQALRVPRALHCRLPTSPPGTRSPSLQATDAPGPRRRPIRAAFSAGRPGRRGPRRRPQRRRGHRAVSCQGRHRRRQGPQRRPPSLPRLWPRARLRAAAAYHRPRRLGAPVQPAPAPARPAGPQAPGLGPGRAGRRATLLAAGRRGAGRGPGDAQRGARPAPSGARWGE